MRLDDFAAHAALRDFVAIGEPPVRALLRRGYEGDRDALTGGAGTRAGVVQGGRAAHAIVELGSGERAVVRRYHRGGAVRHLIRDRYFIGHRAFEELLATERAREAGVRVPRVLAAAERGARWGYTASLATGWIAGGRELARWLAEETGTGSATMLADAGAQVARMHAGGVAHPDLNLRNLLVAPAGELFLLDFDRARLYDAQVPAARRRRDLLRLARSARKLRAPIGRDGWAAFREGYGLDWPSGLSLG